MQLNRIITLDKQELFYAAKEFINRYPTAAQILVEYRQKANCPFPFECSSFPCNTLTCNADVCGNGHAYRQS